ncbi:MAG: DUF6445 family protein [Novosphingobium sp.]
MTDRDGRRWTLHRVGHEATAIVTLDDALRDPDRARDLAARSDFRVDSPFYPGVRAALPAALELELVALAEPILREVFGQSGAVRVEGARFALVCAPPHKLSPPQRLPHFDGTEASLFACVLYLATRDHGGTGFYRHAGTGFESITPERSAPYFEQLRSDLQAFGTPPPQYFAAPSRIFAETAAFPAQFNRMLLYPGNVLHSGLIDNQRPPPASIADGRLTITCFFRVG